MNCLIWTKIDKLGLFIVKKVNIEKSAYMSLTHSLGLTPFNPWIPKRTCLKILEFWQIPMFDCYIKIFFYITVKIPKITISNLFNKSTVNPLIVLHVVLPARILWVLINFQG
jgi:hypothetical protein